jgi:hypothetical protein
VAQYVAQSKGLTQGWKQPRGRSLKTVLRLALTRNELGPVT